jgi:hypothetical protein
VIVVSELRRSTGIGWRVTCRQPPPARGAGREHLLHDRPLLEQLQAERAAEVVAF